MKPTLECCIKNFYTNLLLTNDHTLSPEQLAFCIKQFLGIEKTGTTNLRKWFSPASHKERIITTVLCHYCIKIFNYIQQLVSNIYVFVKCAVLMKCKSETGIRRAEQTVDRVK